MKVSKLLVLCILIVCAGAAASAQLDVPKLDQRVTDFTNSLSFNEWRALETRLQRFEDSTSTQIAVLLVNSLKGEAIEDYSMQVFEKNKIGQKSKDNGVLIVVAKSDHRARIDAGYGLEGVLTDALSSEIVNDEMIPYFRANNFYAGLSSGVSAVMAATAGEYKAKPHGGSAPLVSGIMALFFIGFFLVFFLPLLATKRRYLIGSTGAFYNSGWGWRSGGWGGGGLGGGGFSGGGWGGGGGMAGGGGASGSW